MQKREIALSQWVDFLDQFSARHEGWLVNIRTQQQLEAKNLALEGISADLKAGENLVSISVLSDPRERLTHSVSGPTAIRLEQTDDERTGLSRSSPVTVRRESNCACQLIRKPSTVCYKQPQTAVSRTGFSSVIITVCSKLATRLPSRVLRVQPSLSVKMIPLPIATWGSMVMTIPAWSFWLAWRM